MNLNELSLAFPKMKRGPKTKREKNNAALAYSKYLSRFYYGAAKTEYLKPFYLRNYPRMLVADTLAHWWEYQHIHLSGLCPPFSPNLRLPGFVEKKEP